MNSETKLFLGIIGATVVLIGGAIFVFSKPTPTLSRQDLIPAQTQTKGNPEAKVFLVEFSDFQCPACKAVQPTVDAIVSQYKDKMVFAYRHFPLDQHPFAFKAAAAAQAAGKQGKFWEMHDLLFKNQDTLSDETINQLAQSLQLDQSKFASDLIDPAIKKKVEDDKSYGIQINVAATPTFYLNGEKLSLSNFGDLKNAVEDAIN